MIPAACAYACLSVVAVVVLDRLLSVAFGRRP